MNYFIKTLTFVLFGFINLSAYAELGMPVVFSDGAVLQCQRDLPVWGWGEPGSDVSVEFSGQTARAKIGSDGKWEVTLKPIEPSYDGRTMTITAEKKTLTFENIVLGEVWLCAGQSNMASSLGAMSRRTRDAGYETVFKFMAKENRTAEDKFLRHLKVPNKAIFETPQRDFEG